MRAAIFVEGLHPLLTFTACQWELRGPTASSIQRGEKDIMVFLKQEPAVLWYSKTSLQQPTVIADTLPVVHFLPDLE